MKFGLFGIGSGPCADPDVSIAVAQAAEAAGYESLWTGEHVVLPDPQAPPSPAPPDFPMLHPSAILSFLAAVTQTIRLGSGIILLPHCVVFRSRRHDDQRMLEELHLLEFVLGPNWRPQPAVERVI